MAIMRGGLPPLVMAIASGAPQADVMTIAQAARDAIIQPARLHLGLRLFTWSRGSATRFVPPGGAAAGGEPRGL